MIHGNPISFQKLVRSDSKEKFYYKKTIIKVLFFSVLNFFKEK